MMIGLLVGLKLSLFVCHCLCEHVEVKLTDGSPVVGQIVDENVAQFLGIPYSQPPVGNLRFRPPITSLPWTEPLECFKFKSACLQPSTALLDAPSAPFSENCLFLNIWAPMDNPTSGRPVMVFFHGGGFQVGTASSSAYNGSVLAARSNIIVVTTNYRLGALGFLYLNGTTIHGNQGLQDQCEALKWVVKNAVSFGGDPGKVTIFGESAGGASVNFHLISPNSAGLFKRGIMESGVANSPWATLTSYDASYRGGVLLEKLGCPQMKLQDQVECLLKASGEDIANLDLDFGDYPFALFYPTIDGIVIPDQPLKLVESGNFNKVDVIVGYNAAEGWLPMSLIWKNFAKLSDGFRNPNFLVNDSMFHDAAMENLPAFVPRASLAASAIIHEYSRWSEPVSAKDRLDSLEVLTADNMFVCPSLHFAKLVSSHVSCYLYNFNGISRTALQFPEWMGSLHIAEVEYIFGEPERRPQKYSDAEKLLSKQIREAFSSFALTGKPTIGSADWPSYDVEKKQSYYYFSGSDSQSPDWIQSNRCRFWIDYLPELIKQTNLE